MCNNRNSRMLTNYSTWKRKVFTLFETVQAQIVNLRHRDQDFFGLSEQVDGTDGYWRKYPSVDGLNSEQFKSKKCAE